MTEKRFSLAYSNDLENDNWWAVRDGDVTLWKEEVVDLLNQFDERNRELNNRCSKLQSRYDKGKTSSVAVLVETENTVLLDKEEFEWFVRSYNDLKRRNKRRKEKNRLYRKELKKRLMEINGLKEFISEDLSSDDKVLKAFLEGYL